MYLLITGTKGMNTLSFIFTCLFRGLDHCEKMVVDFLFLSKSFCSIIALAFGCFSTMHCSLSEIFSYSCHAGKCFIEKFFFRHRNHV